MENVDEEGQIKNSLPEMSTKTKVFIGIFTGVWIIVMLSYQFVYWHTIRTLQRLSPYDVSVVRIYPRTGAPSGRPYEFAPSEPLVSDLLKTFQDVKKYTGASGDSVASSNLTWFVEIVTDKRSIEIHMVIYSGRNFAVGKIEKHLRSRSTFSFGRFQSTRLYGWYQIYSGRWLSAP